MGTYWAWEATATLRCAQRRSALRCPQREERGGGISWRPPARLQLVIISLIILTECGGGFTSKLEGMFKDMELSKDIMVNFRQVG